MGTAIFYQKNYIILKQFGYWNQSETPHSLHIHEYEILDNNKYLFSLNFENQ